MREGERDTERERDGGKWWRLLGNIRHSGSEVKDKRGRERREEEARGGGKAMTERENEKAHGDGEKVKQTHTHIRAHTHTFFNQYCGNVAPW